MNTLQPQYRKLAQSSDRCTPSLDTQTCPPCCPSKTTQITYVTSACKVQNLQQYRRISPGECVLLNYLPSHLLSFLWVLVPPVSNLPRVPLWPPLLIRFRIWWHNMWRPHWCVLAPLTHQVIAWVVNALIGVKEIVELPVEFGAPATLPVHRR